jgi:tRNA dimethylallyltransferase
MNKILVICGPTATGKTSLALYLAKVFGGEIVSADSRQVYQGMDIGTGKDLPKSAVLKKGFLTPVNYIVDGVNIWGYDLISPKKDYSVAQYTRTVEKIIKQIWKRKKLAILVGGTGLYIKSVIDGIPTASVPRNIDLRKNLQGRTVDELYDKLAQLDSIKAASLNSSDRKNPRRLTRAIEIAQWGLSNRGKIKRRKVALGKTSKVFFVGLTSSRAYLWAIIKRRIAKRLKGGILAEIEKLLRSKLSWESQSMNSLGYKQWKNYFLGKTTKKSILARWEIDEINYAKRQMTWFKKDKRILWFDISKKGYQKEVEKTVKKWYGSKIKN